jgi:4-amino-4-deoxy-L-arabinose transferase-like glycosyltransferase
MEKLIKTANNVYSKLRKILGIHTVSLSILFVIGLSLRLWRINSFGLHIDESIYAYIASDILRGKIIYKEIVDNKMPYFFFTFALMLFLSGKSIIFPRLVTSFISTLTFAFVYHIGKELYDREVGLLAAGIFLLDPLSIFWSRYVLTEPYMVFFSSFAIYMYILYRKNKNGIFLLLSGLFSGVSFFMKQPGIITLLVIFACIFIDTFGKEGTKRKETIAKQVVVSLLGVIIAILPGLTYLWLHNALGDFIQWSFIGLSVFKATISARLKIFYVVLNFNLLIWTLGLSGVLLTLKNRSQSDLIALCGFLIPFTILISLPLFLNRYFVQVIPFLSILSGVILSKLILFTKQLPVKEFSHGKTILGVIITGIVLVPYLHSFPFIFYTFEGQSLYQPGRDLREQRKVGLYLEAQTNPGEKIFAFRPRYVFLANRETISKYTHVVDWYFLDSPHRADIIKEIFGTLVSSKVNYAVFDTSIENLKQIYPAPDLLEIINYIQENYTLEKYIYHAWIYIYNGGS